MSLRQPALLVLASALGLAACDSSVANAQLIGEYVLTGGSDADGALLDFRAGGRFAALPVCNDVSGTYVAAGQEIELDVTGTTFANCGDRAGVETAFLRALESRERYAIVGDRLTLSGSGADLVFRRLEP